VKVVLQDSWHGGALAVAMMIEAFLEVFLCQDAGLWEAVHPLLNFNVDEAIACDCNLFL
jgi:hypothetical protein